MLVQLNEYFDLWAGYYLTISNSLKNIIDTFISKDAIKIKQIFLYIDETQKMDLTDYIHEHRLNYHDIDMFLEKKKKSLSGIDLEKAQNLHLEIVYHHGEENYRIVYGQGEKIQFPIYPSSEIKSHRLIDNYQNGVLFATYRDKDVTDLLKEYAGPKGNFYQDKDIYITLDKIKYALHVYRDKDDPEHELIITDNFAQDHTFQSGDKVVI